MYDSNNVFAKIIRGEIPSDKVFDNEHVLAFKDLNPSAPIHVLVIPKGEFKSFNDFAINADATLKDEFFKTVQKIAKMFNLDDDGYRLITNHGKNACQSVEHFHVHILGGKNLGPLVLGDEYHK